MLPFQTILNLLCCLHQDDDEVDPFDQDPDANRRELRLIDAVENQGRNHEASRFYVRMGNNGREVVNGSQIENYRYRGQALQDFSMYDYAATVQVVAINNQRNLAPTDGRQRESSAR